MGILDSETLFEKSIAGPWKKPGGMKVSTWW